MTRKTRGFFSASAAALCIAVAVVCAPLASAASINYGNFGPVAPGVSFLQVTESSGTDPVPLYGPPDPFVTGMDFDPTSFVASATSGSADITDGQMNFTVMGQVNGLNVVAISALNLFEGGDYSLIGAGTAATQVVAGAIMNVKVTEIDGNPVAPIVLTPSNGSVGFNLPANAGVAKPWSLGLLVDIEAQLTALSVPFIVGATKAEVVLNNTLIAISEPASVAFIAKKEFIISVVPDPGLLPEPNTLALAGVALCGIGLVSRRRSN